MSYGRNGNGRRNGNGHHARQATRPRVDPFEGPPPHAYEAECAVLGSMILDWRVCGDVIQVLKGPEDFYRHDHAAIYEVLIGLYNDVQSIDAVQIRQRLEDRGILDQVGGMDRIVELFESVPSATSAAYYASIVRDKAALRGLIESAGQILDDAYNSAEPVADLLDKAERAIFDIADKQTAGEPQRIGSVLQDTYDALQTDDGLRSGLETGFYELDEMTHGLQDGDMVVIAARPSMGKTALVLNIAEHVAATTRQGVALFSLEMSREQLSRRLMCSRSGVDSHRLRCNRLSQDEFSKLALTVGEMSEAPLHIDDTPGLSLLQLRAKARRLASRHVIKLIVIDYLQLMNCPGAESRQQEVSALSRGIKAIARELNVPVICLSQLNRNAENRANNKPMMSDLRESGSIEQDADVVMLLHREDYYHRDDPTYMPNNQADLILTKQRNGPVGTVTLQWNAHATRFGNLSRAKP